MKENKAAENVLATIGAALWALQAIPQVYKSYRTKSTRGLSPLMMCIWAASSLFFCVYVSSRHLAIPMVIQPHLTLIFLSIAWAQCLYYSYDYSFLKSLLYWVIWMTLAAVFEVGSIFGLLAAKRKGTEVPMVVYGYTSSALSFIGLLPQYYEIYRSKEVTGLSLTFVFTDIIGAIFYILSLFFRTRLDISAFVMYAVTAVMVIILVILALILNPRAAKQKRVQASISPTMPPLPTSNETGDIVVEEKPECNQSDQTRNPEPVTGLEYFVQENATHSYPAMPGSTLV
ncbi:uncharacterized protein I206_103397 [Kwoniella pini CBS 10737]|uniref:Uncharacterized protein n=1 Tax=Kwoniella pini CBS 10737 TaxID=1296096 RepID=A0AAJ8MQ98_9TREE